MSNALAAVNDHVPISIKLLLVTISDELTCATAAIGTFVPKAALECRNKIVSAALDGVKASAAVARPKRHREMREVLGFISVG